jgi:hypothetical protein
MDYDDEASDPLFLDAMHAIVLLFGAEPDEAQLAALARILVQLAADYEKTLAIP